MSPGPAKNQPNGDPATISTAAPRLKIVKKRTKPSFRTGNPIDRYATNITGASLGATQDQKAAKTIPKTTAPYIVTRVCQQPVRVRQRSGMSLGLFGFRS